MLPITTATSAVGLVVVTSRIQRITAFCSRLSRLVRSSPRNADYFAA